ncbi:uncharacterized protein [Choristoneura fumiferana]|uniref:uncharacterized protein n=1 Tax=Choristoneura fumiferana TaxID=7141 RepID=UPI003D153AA8
MCDGAKFREHTRTVAGKVRWRCTSHDKFGCKAAVYTIGNQIVYVKGRAFFSTTARGRTVLLYGGFRFRPSSRSLNNKVRWRCTTHAKYRCPAAIQTIDNVIVRVKDLHATSFNS